MSYSNTNLNGVPEINKLNSAKICELGKQQQNLFTFQNSFNCLCAPPDLHPLPSALDWCIQQQSGLMLLGRWSIGDLPAGIPFLAFSKCKQKNMDMRKRNTYAHPTVSNKFDR